MSKVFLLVGERQGRFPGSNCLYLKGVKSRLLVDAGCKREQIMNLRDKVDGVIYTHVHPDHITHHELLRGKRVYMPVADGNFDTIEKLSLRYAPEVHEEWTRYVNTVFGLKTVPQHDHLYEPWESISIGDLEVEAVPAPGHTRGHHILWIEKHLHLSDIDLTSFGPWYGHPESSLEAFIADIELAYSLEASYYTTSHRERVFTRDEVLRELDRYRNALERQLASVLELLRSMGPSTPKRLAREKVIYKRYLPGHEVVMNYFEINMVEKILVYLSASRGVVFKSLHGYVARDSLQPVRHS
ncbi:MAG: MBL fold metallo-hydrolase [Desulfurococcales archaeon]|nr:MBL fold metallo-hydrolase [Desulfurococcales archaeon]